MGRTDPFQPEQRSMDLSSMESSSPSPTEQGGESPKNKTSSFSISAILSEDVGRRRTQTANTAGGAGKQMRMEGNGGGGSPTSTISLSQAANMMMTSPVGGSAVIRPALHPTQVAVTSYPPTFLHRTPTQPSYRTPTQPSHHTPTQPSHHTPIQPSHNSSLSMSPFNTSLLQVLGQQSSPASQGNVFEDSLGMLSTVALYHSELSSTSSASTPVKDRLAAMRITSTSDLSEGSRESTDASESAGTAFSKKSTTPYILKRDKRRRRKSSGSFHSQHSELRNSCEESATLNVGFLSPSSVEKSPSKLKHLTFSPSIFLSRPDGTSASIVSTSEYSSSSGSVLMSSPTSESECAGGGGGSGFVTSTPIKSDKENVLSVSPSGWSPSLLHSGSRRRKHVLREPTELSSGSDSELPPKRPRTVPRKSKARTKLSPLLENACSPIAKANPPQPSPLITASVPVCTSMYIPSSSLPLISVQDHNHTTSAQTFYLPHVQPVISQPAYPQLFASPGQLMMAQQHMYMPLPTTQLLTQHYYNNIMTSTQWNASPLPAQWGKTGPIQSVPPWFIFSNNKSEGKRSRLTEAINHSISETPLQNPKLPPGWTKLACGQTDDQKTLTEKARSFLQCRPRQLTFDDAVN